MNERKTKPEEEIKPKKIAFFGHFDSSNFGNEVTFQVVVQHLRRFQPNAEITCISTGPEATIRTYQIEAIPISERLLAFWSPRNLLSKILRRVFVGIPSELYLWIKAFWRLRHTDMLIVPGTGLLTDAYGLLGWGPYNMLKWCLIAKACQCKVLFVSVGAGPIYGYLGRYFVKSALSLGDFRSYRDNSTKQYLKRLGFNADNDLVYPDLAFSLCDNAIPLQNTRTSGRSVVGVGLMDYPGKYSVCSSKAYLEYLETLANVATWLLTNQYDIRILIGDLGDVHVAQEFIGLLRQRVPDYDEGRVIYDPICSVGDLLSHIASTDTVIGTRFHNVLLALLCNKPVISISFHHKCESLMSVMGLSAYCLDINDLKADMVIEKFRDLEINAGKLKPLIRKSVIAFRRALDEQYNFMFNELLT